MARKRNLTREKIVAAAADLVNEMRSFDAITLKEVATAVNVQVPSLYNHIDNTDDLRQALRAEGLERLYAAIQSAAVGRAGHDAIRSILYTYRAFALANPGLYPLILIGRPNNEDDIGEKIVMLLLTVLEGMDITGDEALHTVRALRSVAHGFVSLERASGFQMALDVDVSFELLVRRFVANL